VGISVRVLSYDLEKRWIRTRLFFTNYRHSTSGFVLQYQVHIAIELHCTLKLHKVFCSRRSGPISHIFPRRDDPRRLSPAVVRILGQW
jgi:hypothetical protein